MKMRCGFVQQCEELRHLPGAWLAAGMEHHLLVREVRTFILCCTWLGPWAA